MENILPRREARENAFLLAFSQTFGDVPLQEALDTNNECGEERPVDVFGQRLLSAYYSHSAEVDDLIRDHLRNWTMERLPRVSLTVLRLALAEMLYGDERKPGVVINEAVELTKKYGADEDYQFVNGLLGPKAKNTKCRALANRPSEGPKAPISTIATITMVTLPSMMGVRPRAKPLLSAPSSDLPLFSSSLMRSAVMTLASTPIPMARMIPAMPGRVRVKLSNTGK